MVKYTIIRDSPIDDNLSADWRKRPINWETYLVNFCNVIEARYSIYLGTEVFFKSEEDLTFFLLRWS